MYCTLTEICMCSATDSRHQWFNYVRQCILFNDLNESWSFVRVHADLASALFGLKVGVCIRAHLHAHVEMFTRCQMSQLLQVVFFFKDKHDRIWVQFVFSFYWTDSTVDNSWSHSNLRLFLNTRKYINHFLKAIII